MHATLFEGSMYDVVNYAYPSARLGGFGLSFMRLGTGDIIKREDWLEKGEFGYYIAQLIMAYGRRVGSGFYLGGAVKMVNQSLDNNSAYGIGMDLSIFKPVNDHLSVGLLIQDIIPSRLRLSEDLETTPYNITAGFSLKNIKWSDDVAGRINFAVELPEDRSAKIHTGFESTWRGRLDIRAGYDRDNVAFGIGLYYKRFRFDYSYKIMDGITDSHRFGISLKIGMSVSEKVRRDIELQDARGSYFILHDRRRQFDFYRGIADDFYQNNDLDSAFTYYQRAVAYRPDDPEVLEKIEEINAIRMNELRQLKARSAQEEIKQSLLDGYYTQAIAFYNQELLVSSLGVIKTALSLEPDEPRFANLRSKINREIENKIIALLDSAREAERKGDLTEAITAYNNILQYSPGDETVKRLVNRIGTAVNIAGLISAGVAHFQEAQYDEAEHDFEEVLRIDTGNPVAGEYINNIASMRRQYEDQKRLESDEEVWKIYLNALEYYRNDEFEKAIELWEEVLKHYPGNEKTLENIKQARLRLNSD